MIRLLLLLVGMLGPPDTPAATPTPPVPTPIGAGPAYQLPAGGHQVDRGLAVGRLACRTGRRPEFAVHVEVFAHGRAVVIPPGVGVAPPRVVSGAVVEGGRCRYPLWTLDPTGVVRVAGRSHGLVLDDLFSVWGQPLGRHRLAGFESRRPVRAYVAGRRWPGDIRRIPLSPHRQIVVEIGRWIPPHPAYRFPAGV
ncbi:MAG: hypothetical protein ACXVY5_00775 [Gaiellales bacterium]